MSYDLDSRPEGGEISKWFIGLIIPILVISLSILAYARHSVVFFGKGRLYLEGASGVSMTTAYTAVGLFIHFHWFWGLHRILSRYANLGKAGCLLLFLASYLFTVWKIITSP